MKDRMVVWILASLIFLLWLAVVISHEVAKDRFLRIKEQVIVLQNRLDLLEIKEQEQSIKYYDSMNQSFGETDSLGWIGVEDEG